MANKKLWGGGFSAEASNALDEFWGSIGFDYRLAHYDIQGSIAHVEMLCATGVITQDECDQIVSGLQSILKDFANDKLSFKIDDEDIHMNIERHLHERIGSVAGKLHTARSRNDQSALDMHLYARDQALQTRRLLKYLITALIEQAEKNIDVIMPGYTHLQRAQPISFAHHLLAYAWMFYRDTKRMDAVFESANISPLGAGALAGTSFPIDRHHVAENLGFAGCYANSLDAVSNRDYMIEMLSANSLIAAHLSRFCEDIILWFSSEFSFITLPDAYCTGSSMMPQKKNADLAELIRGKTGRVYGHLISLLTVLKGTPLTYNKDFQEDKECLFDSNDTIQNSLLHFTAMIKGMTARADNMLKATKDGFLNATDVADYLVTKGIPFRETHEIAAKIVAHCYQAGITINDLSLDDFQKFHENFEDDIFKAIDIQTVVNRRNSYGGTAAQAVKQQLEELKNALAA